MPRPLKCDRILCATILALVFVGLIMVFSATTGKADGTLRYGVKQIAAALVGIAAMRVLMFVDYRRFRKPKIIFLALGGVVALLGMVLLGGSETAGTLRFLQLWDFFSIQPSELAKLALVLFLAFFLEKRADRLHEWRTLAAASFILTCLCGLIFAGRDLGTPISLFVIAAVVLWAAGLRVRYFVVAGILAAILITVAIRVEPFRKNRWIAFMDPGLDPQGIGYQIRQSQIAVGSGGVFGQGLMNGKQKMKFLPAAHTDFIFAVICEEFGLLGGSVIVLAFGVLLWRGVWIALRAPDRFGFYLATGITAMIVCQAMMNLGVVLALLPTKGMPLPFISYGGTSMVTCLTASGILLNVSQRAS